MRGSLLVQTFSFESFRQPSLFRLLFLVFLHFGCLGSFNGFAFTDVKEHKIFFFVALRTRAIHYCSDVKQSKNNQLEIVRRFDGDIRFVAAEVIE